MTMNSSSIFFSFFLLLQGLFAAEVSTVSPKKWSLYKTRFNQRPSTPLESLAYAGSFGKLNQFWEMLGGDEAFMASSRIEYDVFDLSQGPFCDLRSPHDLDLKFLKSIKGTLVSFSIKSCRDDHKKTDLHYFDPLLQHIMTGASDVALSNVFGFSVSRQYRVTILKLWTFGKVHSPFYQTIGDLVGSRRFGLARETLISSYARKILRSHGFISILNASDDSKDEDGMVSPANTPSSCINPDISFVDVVTATVVPVDTDSDSEHDSEDTADTKYVDFDEDFGSGSSEEEEEDYDDDVSSVEKVEVIIREPVGIVSNPLKSSTRLTENDVVNIIISMQISPQELFNLSSFTARIRDALHLRK
jgi:hypothetical protein